MADIRILVAESDAALRKAIRERAAADGILADEACDGIGAIKLFRRNEYNLIVLDTSLPELDGINVCRQVRKVSDVPVIFTGESCSEGERLACFENGGDDYMQKPLSMPLLMARIRVILYRSGKSTVKQKRLAFRGVQIDTFSRIVYIDEKSVTLTNRDFELLLFLSQNPNVAFSRGELLDRVWGDDYSGSDRTVDTHIKTLRERIKPYGSCIATVWGYGYKLEP
jgi:DNA-binding response OmpR family regulator